MLVYEAGGFFAPHKDSEKAPGMFGTLVVTLPSTHAGGALEVRHDGETVRFASGEGPLTDAGWCAFYADCEHEILRVESGYRVALTYNLLRGGEGPAPAPPSQQAAAASLRTFAARWTAGKDYGRGVPAKLCKFLEHEYTETSIEDGWDCLKGEDAALAEALHESDAFDIYLCVVQREENGDAECMEVHDSCTDFTGWVPHEDATVPDAFEPSGLDVHSSEYTDEDYFHGIDPYEEDGGYPTGNEGCPFTKWYRAAALIFWPKARRVPVVGLNGAIGSSGMHSTGTRPRTPATPAPVPWPRPASRSRASRSPRASLSRSSSAAWRATAAGTPSSSTSSATRSCCRGSSSCHLGDTAGRRI